MNITSNMRLGVLTVSLWGELDHHGASDVRKNIDAAIERESPTKLRLQLTDVHFCDSSGLGLIMGRYKKARSVGADISVLDPSAAVEKIMRLAGLDKLIKIERSNGNERSTGEEKVGQGHRHL